MVLLFIRKYFIKYLNYHISLVIHIILILCMSLITFEKTQSREANIKSIEIRLMPKIEEQKIIPEHFGGEHNSIAPEGHRSTENLRKLMQEKIELKDLMALQEKEIEAKRIQARQIIEEANKSPEEKSSDEKIDKQTLTMESAQLAKQLESIDAKRNEYRNAIFKEKVSVDEVLSEFSSYGAKEGVERILDIGGHSQPVLDSILNEYGITIKKKYIDNTKPRNDLFLSAATFQNDKFANLPLKGEFDVMTLTETTIRKLALLEMREMEKRNLDLSKTIILKEVFSIIKTPQGYDLGITELETKSIE